MTDVREPETQIEAVVEADTKPRRSLVSRALSPIRRRSRQELARAAVVDVRAPGDFDFERKTKTNPAIPISLILVVLLPIMASGIYLFAFASDQYVAETRFAVRKAEAGHANDGVESASNTNAGSVASSSLLSGGTNLVSEDAEIIANYIHSRAAVEDVSRMVDVRAIFQRPEADYLVRLADDAKAEDLTKYWNRMVKVYVESSSGIVIVSASAFRREDALALTKAILTASENLANTLTVKMRADQTKLAEDEVVRSEAGIRSALANLTVFRNAKHLIDPVESSQSAGKLLLQLMSDRIQTEGQLFVTQRSQGPDAPGIGGTKAKLESINSQIVKLQDQLAGNKEITKNMAATMSEFEELEVKKEFSEKMFEFARQGLERAQLIALAQSIYLAVFVPPSLPQDHLYPERFTDFFLIALAAIMTWVSGATITASILDHRL